MAFRSTTYHEVPSCIVATVQDVRRVGVWSRGNYNVGDVVFVLHGTPPVLYSYIATRRTTQLEAPLPPAQVSGAWTRY